jgi:hypothetical protein
MGDGTIIDDRVFQTVLRDPDPGSGAFITPWIRDPGWVKIRIRIRDEQTGSYFRELRKNFGVKIFKFFYADPGWKKFAQHWFQRCLERSNLDKLCYFSSVF